MGRYLLPYELVLMFYIMHVGNAAGCHADPYQQSTGIHCTQVRKHGIAPEMNLRNSLHTGEKARKWGIHPGLETHGILTDLANLADESFFGDFQTMHVVYFDLLK